MIRASCLAALLTACLLSSASAADQYLVEFQLWLDGELAGTPVLIVEAGEPASLEKMGEPHFRLSVMVESPADSILPQDMIWLHVAVEQLGPEGWEELVDSMLGAREGELTSLSLTDEHRAATPETATLYLQAKTSRLLQAAPSG